jgi:CHAD domain-containing protein
MSDGCQILAAQYIRRQAKQLAEQLEGVRAAEDIEFVHRARVATRRLRAALTMFNDCLPAKRIKRWRKAIRRITSALGDARDRDVQVEMLCATLSALSANERFPGIARVLVWLEHDRERLQKKVVKAVDRLETDGVLREIRRATKKILAKSDLPPESLQRPEVAEHLAQHVLRQLTELLDYQDSLANSDDQDRHHAMRIAAKRLRYTLEISRPAFPGRLDNAITAIKRVQSLLGDIHDCDIWLDHLDAFTRAERSRIVASLGHDGQFMHLLPGIEYLRNELRARHELTFRELTGYWADLCGQQVWDALRMAVQESYRDDVTPAELIAQCKIECEEHHGDTENTEMTERNHG